MMSHDCLALQEKELIPKVQGPLVERYKDRPGGYTRVLRIPNRKGDSAEMAVIEYVDNGLPPLPHPKVTVMRRLCSMSHDSHVIDALPPSHPRPARSLSGCRCK